MDKILTIPEEHVPLITSLLRWWKNQKHLTPEHRRRSKGGSSGSKTIWATVIRCIVRADAENEITGYDSYILRLETMDINDIAPFSAQEYPEGSIVKAAGWVYWDESELEIIYKAKTATGGDGSPNNSTYWEPVDLVISRPYQYGGHTDNDLRNYIPWFPDGSTVPVLKRKYSDRDEWFIDAALVHTAAIGSSSICWDKDEDRAKTIYR